MLGEILRDPGACRQSMTTSNDSADAFEDAEGGYDERRRLVLDQLSHLDELTPADEEEISRFRSYAAASPKRQNSRFGRIFGHRPAEQGRVAS